MTFLPAEAITGTIDRYCSERTIAIDKDLIWIMSLYRVDSVPMWLGYNCKISNDNIKIQTVEFLPPKNDSPTSPSIVQEALNITKKVAQIWKQEQIIATYDLAIGKLAMQIQYTQKPEFDNVFINLGAFHMQMTYFKAIGKYIDSSGLMDILVEADALAGGSTNSFLDSKHFNRCKRLPPLLSGALQVLHFEEHLVEAKKSFEPMEPMDEDTRNRKKFSDSENNFEILKEDLKAVMNTMRDE